MSMITFGTCPSGTRSFHVTFTIPQNDPGDSHSVAATALTATGLAPGTWWIRYIRTRGTWDSVAWGGGDTGGGPVDWPNPISLYTSTISDADTLADLANLAWPCSDPVDNYRIGYGDACVDQLQFGSCWSDTFGPCQDPESPTIGFQFDLQYWDFYPTALYPYTVDIYGQMTPFSPPP